MLIQSSGKALWRTQEHSGHVTCTIPVKLNTRERLNFTYGSKENLIRTHSNPGVLWNFRIWCGQNFLQLSIGSFILGGGTDLERGYGDMGPWRHPFHTSPAVHKGPISIKSISSQGPLVRKFGNFSLYTTVSIFAQILALKLTNLAIFS